MSADSNNRVKVAVRIRPLLGSELEAGAENVIKADKSQRIIASIPTKKNTFDFDWSFGPLTEHKEIYNALCKPLISSVFEGYNATVFAYGQTGSGKTHTMGNAAGATEGVIPFAIADIFQEKDVHEAKSCSVTLEMSFMEVYMEECYDLFSPDRKKIDLRETVKGETLPEGLTIRPVQTPMNVQAYLTEASHIRSTGRTAMNAHSSRSHAVCTFYITVSELSACGRKFSSKLHLVDLAGSERAKKTMATGEAFQEGISINKGLLALGNVIVALSTQGSVSAGGAAVDASKKAHIPYRDSKITRLLKDSLGGNGKTVMLACVSPADVNFEETLNTLRFASRASTIVNNASVNVDDIDFSDSAALKEELLVLRSENRNLLDQVEVLRRISSESSSTATLLGNGDGMMSHMLDEAKSACERALISLSTVNEMASMQKCFLIRCLEEDFPLDDESIQNMSDSFTKAKDMIATFLRSKALSDGSSDSSPFAMDLSFLPPIMRLIEDLDSLQSDISKAITMSQKSIDDIDTAAVTGPTGGRLRLQNSSHVGAINEDEFSSEAESAVEKIMSACDMEIDITDKRPTASNDLNSFQMAEDLQSAEQEHQNSEAAVFEKDQHMATIAKIAEQYKETIMNLRGEISALQAEKQILAQAEAQEASSSVSSKQPDGKVKKELLEKSRLLEQKQKELRLKEVEYARIYQEKERVRKESELLRKDLDESMKKRVAMQKKLKDESESHNAEKKKLLHAEMQSRKRELHAQDAVAKLNKEFSNKEKVLRSQIEEKEREVKRQKELIEKQQKVKAMRDVAPKRFSGMGSAGLGIVAQAALQSNTGSLPTHRVTTLELWLSQELESQSKRNCVQEDIQAVMEARAKISRRLHILRTQRSVTELPMGACGGIVCRSTDDAARDNEIKQLEEDVRLKSISIAKQQGYLADLGSVIEKRRFAGITDPREAKVVMSWMFQKLSKDDPLAIKALDVKVMQQDEQIETLKRQLLAAESQIQVLTAEANASLDVSGSSLSTTDEAKTSSRAKQSQKKERASSGESKRSFEVAFRKQSSGVSKSAKLFHSSANSQVSKDIENNGAEDPISDEVGNISIISGDEDVELEDLYEDPLDESFRPSDDESEDDDENRGNSRKKSKRKQNSLPQKKSLIPKNKMLTLVNKRNLSEVNEADTGDLPIFRDNADEVGLFSSSKPSRRNSISGRLNETSIPLFPLSNLSELSMGTRAEQPKLRKLRRASLSGMANLSFVSDVDENSRPHSAVQDVCEPLDNYKVSELKDFLSSRGLIVSGKKADLVARLREYEKGYAAIRETTESAI